VPVGTWRYSSEVTMAPIVGTSPGVSRWGEVCGQDGRSSSAHAVCLDARPETDSATDPGTGGRLATGYTCARSTALRIRSLASPCGRRSPERLKPEVCNRARANRSSAASFSTRRRSVRISCPSSGSVMGGVHDGLLSDAYHGELPLCSHTNQGTASDAERDPEREGDESSGTVRHHVRGDRVAHP
jgi:hypothetical protein